MKKYSEEELKQMFLDLFFWVAENRLSWFEEAITRRKIKLKNMSKSGQPHSNTF